MVGLRHGQGATPGAPVPQGVEAGKLEQSIQSLHKYVSYCTAVFSDPGCTLLSTPSAHLLSLLSDPRQSSLHDGCGELLTGNPASMLLTCSWTLLLSILPFIKAGCLTAASPR